MTRKEFDSLKPGDVVALIHYPVADSIARIEKRVPITASGKRVQNLDQWKLVSSDFPINCIAGQPQVIKPGTSLYDAKGQSLGVVMHSVELPVGGKTKEVRCDPIFHDDVSKINMVEWLRYKRKDQTFEKDGKNYIVLPGGLGFKSPQFHRVEVPSMDNIIWTTAIVAAILELKKTPNHSYIGTNPFEDTGKDNFELEETTGRAYDRVMKRTFIYEDVAEAAGIPLERYVPIMQTKVDVLESIEYLRRVHLGIAKTRDGFMKPYWVLVAQNLIPCEVRQQQSYTPREVAYIFELERQPGLSSWRGFNPFNRSTGANAFVLGKDGSARDGKAGVNYSAVMVAAKAGFPASRYSPLKDTHKSDEIVSPLIGQPFKVTIPTKPGPFLKQLMYGPTASFRMVEPEAPLVTPEPILAKHIKIFRHPETGHIHNMKTITRQEWQRLCATGHTKESEHQKFIRQDTEGKQGAWIPVEVLSPGQEEKPSELFAEITSKEMAEAVGVPPELVREKISLPSIGGIGGYNDMILRYDQTQRDLERELAETAEQKIQYQKQQSERMQGEFKQLASELFQSLRYVPIWVAISEDGGEYSITSGLTFDQAINQKLDYGCELLHVFPALPFAKVA